MLLKSRIASISFTASLTHACNLWSFLVPFLFTVHMAYRLGNLLNFTTVILFPKHNHQSNYTCTRLHRWESCKHSIATVSLDGVPDNQLKHASYQSYVVKPSLSHYEATSINTQKNRCFIIKQSRHYHRGKNIDTDYCFPSFRSVEVSRSKIHAKPVENWTPKMRIIFVGPFTIYNQDLVLHKSYPILSSS